MNKKTIIIFCTLIFKVSLYGTDERNASSRIIISEKRSVSDSRSENPDSRNIHSDKRDILTKRSNLSSEKRDNSLKSRQLSPVYIGNTDELKDTLASHSRNFSPNTLRIGIRFIWPLDKIRVTSKWGYRTDPLTGLFGRMHKGIDLAAPIGTSVYAPEAGVVRSTKWAGGYGKLLIIDHEKGYSTRLGHLSDFSVQAGDIVKKGDVVARTGNTGRSTGPHLHYEIRYGDVTLDPMILLKNNLLSHK